MSATTQAGGLEMRGVVPAAEGAPCSIVPCFNAWFKALAARRYRLEARPDPAMIRDPSVQIR